jgi:NAD+ synthase
MKMERKIILPGMDAASVRKEIGDFAIGYCTDMEKSGYVIGLSGGIDSTASAAIIGRSFQEYNLGKSPSEQLELVGYILPSSTNNSEDEVDGCSIAKRLGIRHEVIGLNGIINAHLQATPGLGVYDRGNMESRIRANILSTRAAVEGKLIAGTGNKDEDSGIGYYTLFGDGAVHISPIGNLSKRLVRDMATYLGFGDVANREPTAGLEPGQTDFGDLGYSYGFVELLTNGLEQGFTPSELVAHSSVVSLAGEQMGRFKQKFGSDKFETVEAMVVDFLRRNEGAKKKVQLISPTVAPVSLSYGPNY